MASLDRPPHILSNPAEKWIAEQSAHSVFYLRACPRAEREVDNEAAKDAFVSLINRLSDVKPKGRPSNTMPKKPLGYSTATGFAIRNSGDELTLLTVAHIIKEVCIAEKHLGPNEVGTLNLAYYFEVMCVHQEREIRRNSQNIANAVRWYTEAEIVAIDSQLDLLALKCPVNGIALSGNDEEMDTCEQHGTTLAIADLPPPKSEKVLLHGWPSLLSDSSQWGNVSVHERPFCAVSKSNPYGYEMRLIEIPQFVCTEGWSGGPVVVGSMVDNCISCVGVFHRTIGRYGYAVSLSDIIGFLSLHHLLGGPRDADEAYELS